MKHDAPELAAYVGLDWADERHAVCLQAADSRKRESYDVEQEPEALHAWVSRLRTEFGGRKIAIALEQSRGNVICALMSYDFLILYPINPKALARYREAFATSKAKDDPTDADLLLDLIVRHRDQFRAWTPDDPLTRQIQALVQYRRKLVQERVRITNRLTSLLKCYFPQALDWSGSLDAIQACDFLEKWPSLEAVRKARPSQLRDFYLARGSRNHQLIEKRIEQIRTAHALTHDTAIVSASTEMMLAIVAQLRPLIGSIQRFNDQIESLFNQHPDHQIFESLPGAGDVLAPRLLAAMGADRDRYDSACDIQQFSGIAPVTIKSGKKKIVYQRRGCARFPKQSFHEFAAQSIRSSAWASEVYNHQKALGKSHHAAVRAVAFKWIRIIFRCWKERLPYDEDYYLQVLRRRNSPYAQDTQPTERRVANA